MIKKQKLNINIAIMGPSYVGKSSLIKRYINDTFVGTSLPTLSPDMASKDFELDGKSVRITLIDTVGDENRAGVMMRTAKIRNVDGVALVLADRETCIESLHNWMKIIDDVCYRSNPQLAVFLNKQDQIDPKCSALNFVEKIKRECVKKDIKVSPLHVYSMSAKAGIGVAEGIAGLVDLTYATKKYELLERHNRYLKNEIERAKRQAEENLKNKSGCSC